MRPGKHARMPWPVLLLLAAYLLLFLVLPVGRMLFAALAAPVPAGELGGLALLAANPLYVESLRNSLLTALGAAVLAGAAALPFAAVLWRLRLRPPLILELFGFLPLFVPPFILSLSLQSLLGRGGALGMLLQPGLDLDPVLWGLPGLACIEAVHYFPLVLTMLLLTTSAFARQADEAACLGQSWWRLGIRVFVPLCLPGLAFGMVITFLKTLDDLATPLSLGLTNLLAPQVYFRVATYGTPDPQASLLAMVIIGLSALAWLLSARFVRRSAADWAMPTPRRPARDEASARRAGLACLALIVLFYGVCYAGALLTSLAGIWSHTPLPESYVTTHYAAALANEAGSFVNTLLYCGVAAVIDVVLGLAMAGVIENATARWKRLLSWAAAAMLSVPGVALAIAYQQFFHGMQLPGFGGSLDATWFLLPMAFSVRGLPFAVRACSFAIQNLPPSYVEAALMSGATRLSIALRIVLPMLAFGLLVAFLICFGVAAVDLSSAMLLVPSETGAPVAYSIYLHMQTSTGRGTGSALAILTIAVVALAMGLFVAATQRRTTASLRHIVIPGSAA